MTNLNRETQKIQKRLAKPQAARLKHKWSKKKKKKEKEKASNSQSSVLSFHFSLIYAALNCTHLP